jgi:ribosomal protein S18 acetylase RimI-like enzyme
MNAAARVQDSIRDVNGQTRDAHRAGSFVFYRHRDSDHPMLNYAVPEPGAGDWGAGIGELRSVFAVHGLRPRLEFVGECAPGLEAALTDAGFEVEGHFPVLTLPAVELREVPVPDGVVIARTSGAADARAVLEVGAEAFGTDPPTDAEVAAYQGRSLLARAEGVPAGAASRTEIADGVSELAGIGVRERFRRRGIAAALTSATAADAIAAGAELCFLTPGDAGAERVYERAGFKRAGTTMVHMVG